MNPNNYSQQLLKNLGKLDAKRVAENTLRMSPNDVFWIQVNNIIKKMK